MGIIKIGLIGAGDIADLHAEAVNSLDGVQLAGLWNRTYKKACAKAEKYNCIAYKCVDDLINDPGIHAVFILTNVETHYEYAIKSVNAGKHILIEKPVASNLAELTQLKEAVERNGIICMPVHNYIYDEGIYRIREMIERGKLGDITQFYMMYNIRHDEDIRNKYPGVIHQILTHHSYVMLYLIGLPKTVACIKNTVGNLEVSQENVAMTIMEMANGALSHLSASFANDDHVGDPWTCMIKVMGTKGSARYSYNDWVINERNGAHSHTYYCYPESIKNVTAFFINKVLCKKEQPLSSLDDAIATELIVEACEQSAKEGIRVDFNLQTK